MLAGRSVKHEGIGMLTYFCGGLHVVLALGGLLRVGAMTQ